MFAKHNIYFLNVFLTLSDFQLFVISTYLFAGAIHIDEKLEDFTVMKEREVIDLRSENYFYNKHANAVISIINLSSNKSLIQFDFLKVN